MAGSTQDLILGGLGAIRSGAAVDSNSIDAANPGSTSNETTDEGQFVEAMESTQDDLLPGNESAEGEDTPADSSTEEQASSEAPKKTSANKEVVTITDEKGKRRVEIDWNNKDQLRKYVQMAHGARKWQAERDQALSSTKQLQSQLSEIRGNWDTLEGVHQKQGIEGVIDLLQGQPGAYKAWVQKAVERQEFLRKASPEEVEALEARESSVKHQRELEQIRKENDKFRKEMAEEREATELRSLESKVHPAFDKYRFAEKLGDSNDEHMFDEMLWNSALKRLQPYEEKGLDISPELIEREFRAVSSALRKRIGLQAEKKASKVVEQKKQEATENVQAKVVSGYKTGGKSQEARDLIQNGNLTGLLKNWGTYGGLFQSKK